MNEHIKNTFLEELPESQRKIETAWKNLRASGWNEVNIQLLSRALQQLSHNALSASYGRMGKSARNFENVLTKMESTPDWPTLEAMFAELQTTMVARESDQEMEERERARQINRSTGSLHETRSNSLIYIVEDEITRAENMAAQVSYFGYSVKTFQSIEELRQKLRQTIPSAILLDVRLAESGQPTEPEVRNLNAEFGDKLSLFFLSSSNELMARLTAIRNAGKAFFVRPVDVSALVDALDKLVVETDPERYRILIVDDSEIQANVNALHLRKANMDTMIVTRALEVVRALEGFNPDLLLLDLYMPDCTGLELARVIRQNKAFVSLPIVYLSAETDREKQLSAVGLGGDDFLTKPIKPDHLISAVKSRIERYRQLQALMLRDSLTGLFNHTTIRERLNQEVAHASRENKPLSLAMIDIDKFKNVNDAYGHGTGDRVLKSLSHMLSHRLRRSDIVGRYGGEEFVIIFPKTDGMAAVNLVNELRESFGQVSHVAGNDKFSVTFSCGIASFPNRKTASALSEAADQALYAAKRNGRNMVVLAD